MSSFIEINDDRDLYVWARNFGITPQELVELVGAVGPSTDRIRDTLKQRELANTRRRSPGTR